MNETTIRLVVYLRLLLDDFKLTHSKRCPKDDSDLITKKLPYCSFSYAKTGDKIIRGK